MKILLSIMLIAAIYSSYEWANSAVQPVAGAPAKTLEISPNNINLKVLSGMSDYQTISNSPLFDEDRKPQQKVVVVKKIEKKQVKENLLVKALGIALAGEKLLAVVKDMKTGKIVRLKINDNVHGWTLKGVSENSLIFSRAEIEKAIRFRNEE